MRRLGLMFSLAGVVIQCMFLAAQGVAAKTTSRSDTGHTKLSPWGSLEGGLSHARRIKAERDSGGPKGRHSARSQPDYPHQDITYSGPLSTIGVGNDLSCQVTLAGDSSNEFYGPDENPADCGTLLSVGGQLYAPSFGAHSY